MSEWGKLIALPEAERNAHSLIIGAPGSGKSTGYYIPNMMRDAHQGVCSVIFDLKYPDAKSGFLSVLPMYEAEGFDVQVFTPFNPNSMSMSFLAGCEEMERAAVFGAMIIPYPAKESDADFYPNQERELLISLAHAFARDDCYSIKDMSDLLSQGVGTVEGYITGHQDAEVRNLLASFTDFPFYIKAGVVNNLKGKLRPFTNDYVAAATQPGRWPWQNVDFSGVGTSKSLLYVGIPNHELLSGRGQMVIRMVKKMIDDAILRNAETNGGELPVHTSVYYDEFANFKHLPNVDTNFATMRSYRVAFHVALQDRAQLETIYGPTEARALLGLFGGILIFPGSLKFEDARYFEQALGEITAEEASESRTSRGAFEPESKTRSAKKVARPLLSQAEMRRTPKGNGIWITSNFEPIRVILGRADQKWLPKTWGKSLDKIGWFRGRRNPSHRFYKDLFLSDQGQGAEMVENLALRRRLKMQTELSLMGELKETVAQIRETKLADEKEAERERQAEEEFRVWAAEVARNAVKSKLYRNEQGEITKITVDGEGLALDEVGSLKLWRDLKLVKFNRTSVSFVAGLKFMEADDIERLCSVAEAEPEEPTKKDLPNEEVKEADVAETNVEVKSEERSDQKDEGPAQPKQVKRKKPKRKKAKKATPAEENMVELDKERNATEEREEPATELKLEPHFVAKGDALTTLQAWLIENANQLEGHPCYTLTKGSKSKEETPLLGFYEPGEYWLDKSILEKSLGFCPPLNEDGELRRVPWGMISEYDELRRYLGRNRHRLEGHPRHEKRLEQGKETKTIGRYKPELVTLPVAGGDAYPTLEIPKNVKRSTSRKLGGRKRVVSINLEYAHLKAREELESHRIDT